jgi:L-lactate dehydrogenase complex protein LldG
VPSGYRRRGELTADARVARFCERVGDYRATVERVTEVAPAVEAACAAHAVRTLLVPDGVPGAWRPSSVALVADCDLSPRELDAVDATLTGCTVAVAESGTIVLTADAHEGRRAVTLVPDIHLCVVRAEQVVELLPEAFERLAALGRERRPITFVSGPSATSDIELRRVEGVHGPRTLVVFVVEEEE